LHPAISIRHSQSGANCKFVRESLANKIGALFPTDRPHFLKAYQDTFEMSSEDFARLAVKVFGQNGESFAMVRADAMNEYKISIDKLSGEWGLEGDNKESLNIQHVQPEGPVVFSPEA